MKNLYIHHATQLDGTTLAYLMEEEGVGKPQGRGKNRRFVIVQPTLRVVTRAEAFDDCVNVGRCETCSALIPDPQPIYG